MTAAQHKESLRKQQIQSDLLLAASVNAVQGAQDLRAETIFLRQSMQRIIGILIKPSHNPTSTVIAIATGALEGRYVE
jgi:hypothetical protein